jgi:general transcription factor 3C polypeptide 3 (transcription factor C subunit 4)
MSSRFPQSLEDTITVYKNQYLADLEDDDVDATLDELPDDQQSSNEQEEDDADLFHEREDEASLDVSDVRHHRRSKLPRDLAGLMGQANVCFARGEHNDAIIMCQEIIRQAPRCSEPFISLAEYFSDKDEEEKAEQLYLIAAYLEPSNVDLWLRVADSATKRREFRLAATCYTKAIKADKSESSISYHLKRCNLYEYLGDQKRALRGYENLVNVLGSNDEKFGLELARGIARVYLNEKKYDDCRRALEGILDKYANQISGQDLEQLSFCYNRQADYIKTVDLFVRHCRATIKINRKEEWTVLNMKTNIEKGLKLPLTVKLDKVNDRLTFTNKCHFMEALISLGYFDDTIKPLATEIDSVDLSLFKEPIFNVAKAYFSQEAFEEAKSILLKLTSRRDIHTGSIWLLYSQCLKSLNEIDEAIEGYREVIKIEPDNFNARLVLSNLLSVQGRQEEALEVTKQPLFTQVPVDIPLLHQSCQLLDQADRWDEFCDSAKALLLCHMSYTHHPKEILAMVLSKSYRTRTENLRYVLRELKSETTTQSQKSIGMKLDANSLLKIFLRYIDILFNIRKDYQELKRICFSAYTCSAFECYESSIDFYTAVGCICTEDREFTYNHLKLLATRNPDNNQLWNLLSMAMNNIYLDLRHGKFCLRQFMRNPDIVPLAIFNGHNALMSGSYKHALGEYMCVFKEKPNNALIAFCLVITYLSLSCQKYISSKYLCLYQMIAFLQTYLELRGSCQEAMYNIGRVFHQVNMLDKAVIFYKKALAMDDRPRIKPLQEDPDEFDEIFDVRREAAFNLALIYKNSQSPRLAHQVIKENFTI